MKRQKRVRLWPVLYGVLLTTYAVFTLLDAFVIPQDMISLEEIGETADSSSISSQPPESSATESEPEEDPPEPPEPSEPVITENSYISDETSITISQMERYGTKIYLADVILKDPSYLKAGLAGGAFGRNITETTSAIAEENDAILAVNGDYYGFRDRGFVMRGGYLYRTTAQREKGYEDLVIYEDGSMEVVEESTSDAAELAKAGAVHIFSFGPGLLQGGEITVDETSEVEQAMRSNPRTAIGEIGPLHYLFVVSDGRTEESTGLTLFQLAQVMGELGCQTAYNLDGGGSSTMWFMGRIVNHPTSGWREGERKVSDIVYIKE